MMESESQKKARTDIRKAMVSYIIREKREWGHEDDIVFDVMDTWIRGTNRHQRLKYQPDMEVLEAAVTGEHEGKKK